MFKKYAFIIACILFYASLTTNAYCIVTLTCKCQYETQQGWSDPYHLTVNFVRGMELNNATKTYRYDSLSNYCVIWFGQGQCAIVKLTTIICNNNCEIITAADLEGSINNEYLGLDQNNRRWKIKTPHW
jgi:hypothetical protein